MSHRATLAAGAAALTVVLVLGSSACSSGSGGQTTASIGSGGTATSSTPGPGDSGASVTSTGPRADPDAAVTTFAALVARMPVPPDGALITAIDHPRSRALGRVGKDVGPDEEVYVTENVAVGGVPTDWITQGPDTWESSLGFGFRDAGLALEMAAPPRSITRIEGPFDADAVMAAITDDDSFGPGYDVVDHLGTPMLIYRGEELRALPGRKQTPERLNRPMRFAVAADRMLIARTTAELETAVEAEQSPRTTPGVVDLLAAGVDSVGGVELVAQAFGAKDPQDTSWADPLFAVGVGAATVEGAPGAYAVIVTRDEADAASRAERIRQQVATGTSNTEGDRPWSELVTLGEVTTDGRTVTVTFPATRSSVLIASLMRRDSLLLLD